MLKKKILRPFTSKYISFKRDGISRWLRWPANLWNISLEKKKKERKKVTQSSLRNIFHLRWNVATKRVPSERERFLRGSYVPTIDATKESLRRIASRSECRWRRRDRLRSFRARRRFSIHLNRLVCSDARSAGRREDSTSILPHVFSFIHLFSSSFFLFFLFSFFLSLFIVPRPIPSWHDTWLFDPACSTQMDHRCCSIRQTSIFIRAWIKKYR